PVQLGVGENTVQIEVSVPLLSETVYTTYTLVINRDFSTELQSLNINPGNINFTATAKDYSVRVGSADAALNLSAMAKRLGAKIRISVNDGASRLFAETGNTPATVDITVPLDYGENTIAVSVFASNRYSGTSPTDVYTVAVYRSFNTELRELRIQPNINLSTFRETHRRNIGNEVKAITLIARARYEESIVTLTTNSNRSPRVVGDEGISVPMNFGQNVINVKSSLNVREVGALTTTATAYTIILTRPISSDARLKALAFDDTAVQNAFDSQNPAGFRSDIESYNLVIDSDIAQFSITATAANEYVRHIRLAGAAVENGSQDLRSGMKSDPLSFAIGETRLSLDVLAQNGNTTKTYSLLVTRPASNDNTLKTLTLSNLPPDVQQPNLANYPAGGYRYRFPYETTSTTVSISAHPEATVKLTVGDVVKTAKNEVLNSGTIVLREGIDVEITVEVTAQDETKRVYVVTAMREANSDNDLYTLKLTGLTTDLNFSKEKTSYNVNVRNTLEKTAVQATAHPQTTITVNSGDGKFFGSFKAMLLSGEISLSAGNNTRILILVTAQNGSHKIYTVNVMRAAQDNSNTELDRIDLYTIAAGEERRRARCFSEFKPSDDQTCISEFKPDDNGPYRIVFGDLIEVLSILPILSDSKARIAAVGCRHGQRRCAIDTSAFPFWQIGLRLDTTQTIVITTESGDNSRNDYTLEVFRPADTDISLTELSAADASGLQPFDVSRTAYTAVLSDRTEHTLVTATATHPDARVTISDGVSDSESSRTVSKRISIGAGLKRDIRIRVTAQRKSVSKEYTMAVSREGSVGTVQFNLTDIQINEISPGIYSGVAQSGTESTEISANQSGASGAVTVQSVDVYSTLDTATRRINLIKDGMPLALEPNSHLISEPILLNKSKDTAVDVTLRVADQTADGYTDRRYTLVIQATADADLQSALPTASLHLDSERFIEEGTPQGAGTIDFSIRLSHPLSTSPVIVPLNIVGISEADVAELKTIDLNPPGIALSDSLLTPIVTFTEGAQSVALRMTLTDNNELSASGNKTATFSLGSPTAAVADPTADSFAVTIADDEYTLCFNQTIYEVNEDDGYARVLLKLSRKLSYDIPVTFRYIDLSAGNSDYLARFARPRYVTVFAGEDELVLPIEIIDDDEIEADELFRLAVIPPRLPDGHIRCTADVRIHDNDPIATIAAGDAIVEGSTATFTVTLNVATEADTQIAVQISDVAGSDFIAADYEGMQTLLIASGEDSAVFAIPTVDDDINEFGGRITATLIEHSGSRYFFGDEAVASLAVDDNDSLAVNITAVDTVNAVDEGTPISFVVGLNGTASEPLTVNLSVSEGTGNYVAADHEGRREVLIAAGQSSTVFHVPTVDDKSDDADGTVTVAIAESIASAYRIGTPAVASYTVRGGENRVSIIAGDAVNEGDRASFTIRR
ncbi:MAG: cadherin-like beta sandwich domain-containing protein, partial [Gammaproteobacteria bacterium]|nr:cadherin-like beta sandwich domain-containing protein [Gammaproteobacteria bacterium]